MQLGPWSYCPARVGVGAGVGVGGKTRFFYFFAIACRSGFCCAPLPLFSIKDSSTCKGCFISETWSQSFPLGEFFKACHFIHFLFGSLCFSFVNFWNWVAYVIIHFKTPFSSYRNQMPVSDFQGLGVFIQSWS